MTNFIPLFPLNIVVFPGEQLNLHIFEPKYKQLIKDCFSDKKIFGIPVVSNGRISEIGTAVHILSIEKEHENGEMDIRTEGVKVFNLLEMIQEIPEKLYSGGIVSYPENQLIGVDSKMKLILKELRYFHLLLEVQKEYKKEDNQLYTYDIAHHIGMSLEQEHEFVKLLREDQRQEYIQRHLKKIIPTIEELQHLKKRIQMNGHFRKLSIEDLD